MNKRACFGLFYLRISLYKYAHLCENLSAFLQEVENFLAKFSTLPVESLVGRLGCEIESFQQVFQIFQIAVRIHYNAL